MTLIDCHTHTQFSADSEADISECVERACRLGLAAYAITDHCECNAWYGEDHYSSEERTVLDYFNYGTDFENSVAAVTALKEKYAGRLNLICGTELGQILLDTDIARKVNADPRLDFIIGSVHQISGEKDFYFLEYDKMTMDEIYSLLERYFKEVYEMCRTGLFDVVGHITYCLRYMKQRHGICADISRFDDIIAESFRILAQNGKGIEINSSGIRQGFGDSFPDLKYTKLFRDMGGEILSIGSDAHFAKDIAANVDTAIRTACDAGFTRLAYFKKRQPEFISIV